MLNSAGSSQGIDPCGDSGWGNAGYDEVMLVWFWFALGSAVFAALTSILAKIGIEGVNSNLATAIQGDPLSGR